MKIVSSDFFGGIRCNLTSRNLGFVRTKPMLALTTLNSLRAEDGEVIV